MFDKSISSNKNPVLNVDQRYLEIVYILLLPIVLLFLYRFSPFNNYDGYIDPWIYFAYTFNFEDLIVRYGLPYYSVRFGLIFPLILMTKLFGSVYGYIIFVYSMYLLAGIPLYLVFRKNFSVHAAILAYSILVSSLWFARAVLWTHPDATAVPYLIAALSLILLNPGYQRITMFAIGSLIALAVNSNFFTLSIGGLISIPYLIIKNSNLLHNLRKDVPWILMGFITIFVIGGIGYYQCCGQYNYLTNTLGMVKWSVSGGGVVYSVPLKVIASYPHNWLLPLLAIAMVFIFKRVENQSKLLVLAISGYLITVVIFVIAYQYYSKTALIETFYYYSFMIVPAIFCIGIIPVVLARASGSEKMYTYICLASFLFPGLLLSQEIVDIATITVNSAFVLCALLLAFIILASIYKQIIPYAVLTLGITIGTIWPVSENIGQFNYTLYGQSEKTGLSRFRLGLQFIELMPKYKETKKPIYFWYRNKDQMANSLQSTYLWGYSRIMDSSEETPGIPGLQGVNFDLLKQPASLVLFDSDKEMVEQGIKALVDSGLRFSIDLTKKICEKDLCYTIAILDSEGFETDAEKAWNTGELTSIGYQLDWHISGNEPAINEDNILLSLKTLPNPWYYAAVGSINYIDKSSYGKGLVKVRLSITGGSAGIGFLGNDQSQFLQRKQIWPDEELQEILLEFINISDIKKIVISSWDMAESATVDLYELEIRAYPGHIQTMTEKLWDNDQLSPVRYDLDWYLPGTDTKLEKLNDAISFRTTSEPWSYSLVGNVHYLGEKPQRSGVVRLLITVRDSNVGFGLLNSDPGHFLNRIEILPMEEPQEYFLKIDNLAEVENIVISNWDNDESAAVDIHKLEIRMNHP